MRQQGGGVGRSGACFCGGRWWPDYVWFGVEWRHNRNGAFVSACVIEMLACLGALPPWAAPPPSAGYKLSPEELERLLDQLDPGNTGEGALGSIMP